jgi:lysophospholipase L1-like esterase
MFPSMSARGRLLSGLVSIVIALAGFVTGGALPAAASPPIVQYVALGDSYAAGTAVGDSPFFCPRNPLGYPGLLASESGIDFQADGNATCSGATALEVSETQLEALDRDTRLVTLTVGAADLGLSTVLAVCTDPLGTPADCVAAVLLARSRLQMLGGDLRQLYADVAEEAPRARIVVTGYPHLFEDTAPVDEAIIDAVNQATDALNTTIRQAVTATQVADVNIHYVDVTDEFAGHGIGAPPQLLFIFPAGPEAFHPTPAGYRAYADAIAVALPNAWVDKQD